MQPRLSGGLQHCSTYPKPVALVRTSEPDQNGSCYFPASTLALFFQGYEFHFEIFRASIGEYVAKSFDNIILARG
jgi:hypothetical protein